MTSMLRSRRLRRGLTAVTALMLVAAACGGDDDDAADEGASTSSAGVAATTGETAATTAATDASSAGTGTTEVAGETTGSAGGETPAPAGVSDAEWEAIVTAAQDEGKVTIYSSQGLDQLNDLAERFNDEYGIELEVVPRHRLGADPQGRGRAADRRGSPT